MRPQLGPRAKLPANVPNGKEVERKEVEVQLDPRREGRARKGNRSDSIRSREALGSMSGHWWRGRSGRCRELRGYSGPGAGSEQVCREVGAAALPEPDA